MHLFIVFVSLLIIADSSLLCPKCDISDYDPVCIDGKAFQSVCHLLNLVCRGQIKLNDWAYGKCLIVSSPKRSPRVDEGDDRIIYSGNVE